MADLEFPREECDCDDHGSLWKWMRMLVTPTPEPLPALRIDRLVLDVNGESSFTEVVIRPGPGGIGNTIAPGDRHVVRVVHRFEKELWGNADG